MAELDTFPGIDECMLCLGKVRPAKRREVEEHLRGVNPKFRAAVEAQPGTWYICPRCGPESAVKWQSIEWDTEPES
jgi:uncharacterized protein with PIN domain